MTSPGPASTIDKSPRATPEALQDPGGLSLLEAALEYGKRGFAVLPLAGKVPLKGGRGCLDATTDLARIKEIWGKHPNANIGIATGAVSGIVVLDSDGPEGDAALREFIGDDFSELPANITSKGRHLLFQHPGTKVKNRVRLREQLDVRGDGGYIVAPPSRHPDTGVKYRWENYGESPAVLPPELMELIAGSNRPFSGTTEPPSETGIPEGKRNSSLTSFAGALRRYGATEADLSNALESLNRVACDPPLSDSEVHQIARSIAGYPVAREKPNGENSDGSAVEVRSLRTVLDDPNFSTTPEAVAPRIAYRGRVTLIAAREKDGKTTLLAHVAARVSCGKVPFEDDDSTDPGTVLWCVLEGHIADVAGTMVEFGADPERIFLVEGLPDGLGSLEYAVELVMPDMVVIDTLSSFAGDQIKDFTSDSSGWTKVMNGLGQVARQSEGKELAIVVTHHARKSDGRYRDSTAIGAGVDVILEMNCSGSDSFVRQFTPKARWTIAPFAVRFYEPDDLEDAPDYRLVDDGANHESRVYDFVRKNPRCSSSRIRKGVMGGSRLIDKAIKGLISRGLILDEGGGKSSHRFSIAPGSTAPGACEKAGTEGDSSPM